MAWCQGGHKLLSEPMKYAVPGGLNSSQGQLEYITILSPDQNGCHFAGDILKCIFTRESNCILIEWLGVEQAPSQYLNQWWLSLLKHIHASLLHYYDVIMGTMAFQFTSLTIVYTTVYSGADQRKHQSSASLAFVWGIHRGPVNSPHKWPVTRKMFPFDHVIMHSDSTSTKYRVPLGISTLLGQEEFIKVWETTPV